MNETITTADPRELIIGRGASVRSAGAPSPPGTVWCGGSGSEKEINQFPAIDLIEQKD